MPRGESCRAKSMGVVKKAPVNAAAIWEAMPKYVTVSAVAAKTAPVRELLQLLYCSSLKQEQAELHRTILHSKMDCPQQDGALGQEREAHLAEAIRGRSTDAGAALGRSNLGGPPAGSPGSPMRSATGSDVTHELELHGVCILACGGDGPQFARIFRHAILGLFKLLSEGQRVPIW